MTELNDLKFLNCIRQYIEEMEVKIEGEWGNCRSLQDLISAGEMPELYHQVTERIKNLDPSFSQKKVDIPPSTGL